MVHQVYLITKGMTILPIIETINAKMGTIAANFIRFACFFQHPRAISTKRESMITVHGVFQ